MDPTDPDECNIEEYYQKMIGGLATVGNVYQKKAENLAGSVLTIENNRQQVTECLLMRASEHVNPECIQCIQSFYDSDQ